MGDSDAHRTETGAALATQLIDAGSDIAGAATGAAIGLIGGPAGVVGGAPVGAVLGRVFRRVGADLRRRMLGPREDVRIGGAAAYAGAMIKAMLDAERQPRDDRSFTAPEGERPPADELLEGVLPNARAAYETLSERVGWRCGLRGAWWMVLTASG
jgi:hypothetical protein